jgi:hypothetical protein
MSAARQRADNHPVRRLQLVDHRARDVSQPTRYPMPLHSATNRFRDDQSDARSVAAAGRPQGMHHEIGLRRPHPMTDGRTELRRPSHPVSSRKHRARSRVESRSELAATLAAPIRHDRPAGPGAHPQPEPVHPRPTTIVGLEGPLALGHGCSLLVASGIRNPPR